MISDVIPERTYKSDPQEIHPHAGPAERINGDANK